MWEFNKIFQIKLVTRNIIKYLGYYYNKIIRKKNNKTRITYESYTKRNVKIEHNYIMY